MEFPPKGQANVITEQAAPEWLGKYPLLSVISKGSMGVLYKSFDPDIKRPVALKTIRRDQLDDDTKSFSARFRNEAQAAGGLTHPGIVAVYEYGEEDVYAYIATEYVEGRSLRHYEHLALAGEQKLPFSIGQVVDILSQLLAALQYAHERGVWHRNINPANILIMSDGRVKVTDFGMARIESSMLTHRGVIMGTPGFIAPEMFLSDTCDGRIDVFAAGVILYQLLAGMPPFVGTPEQVIFKVCHETPLPPSVVGRVPSLQPFDAIVMRALARRLEDRFASAARFREALLEANVHMGRPGGSDETIIRPRPSVPDNSRPTTKESLSEPPSTTTRSGAGLSMDELARIEKRLTRFVGPIARVMVRRAAKDATDVVSLTHRLAGKISASADREEFLKDAGIVSPPVTPPPRSSPDRETIGSRQSGTPARPPTPLTPEDMARASQLLAVFMGPLAPILVKRAAKPGSSREQFVAAIAAHLSDDGDRARFLSALG